MVHAHHVAHLGRGVASDVAAEASWSAPSARSGSGESFLGRGTDADAPADIDGAIRRRDRAPGFAFTDSIRHAVEVDFHDYRKRLMTKVEGGRAF